MQELFQFLKPFCLALGQFLYWNLRPAGNNVRNLIFTDHELFLFLNKLSDEGRERNKLPDDSYIITCAHITTFDVIAIDGEKYAIPRNYALLETMPSSVRNFAQDETFLKKAVDELIRSDSIWENVDTMQNRYHVYKLDQLLSMVKAG